MRAPGTSHDPLPMDRTQTLGPRSPEATPSDGGATGAATVDRELDTAPGPASDRYELLAEHARGGLGRVVRAHDRHLGRTVAVKELLRTNELAEALFVREALITARLQHPGIVPVHEAGRWPNGDPYYVMKLVQGRTLKECIAQTHSLSDRLALLPHVIAVAEAVGYAHSNDIIHRDLKPANTIIGEYGETVVIDWGLARDLRHADSTPPIPTGSSGDGRTVTGRVVGTPQYMAPEQARGEAVDPRADVYALGAILYEVLSGRAPVGGDSAQEIIDRVLAGPPAPLAKAAPGVPSDLEAVVAKAMARFPEDRYPTARELAADLKRFQTGQLVTAQRYGRWSLIRRWVRRNRGYVALGAIATIAVTVIAVGMLRRVLDERRLAELRGEQAELQRAAAEDRKNQLVLAQVEAALPRDPTAAMAWLKNYPIDAASSSRIAALVDEAESLGVATHVWRGDDWMMGVAVTGDGSRAAIGGRDGQVRVVDTASGAVRVLGTRPALTGVGFDGPGNRLLTADVSGEIVLWDLASGRSFPLGKQDGEVTGFAPAADGRVASLGMDGSVRIWDLERRTIQRDLFAELAARDRVATAWDGRTGATRLTADLDGNIVLRRDGEPPRVVTRMPLPVHMIAMTSDARKAVAVDGENAYLIDLAGGPARVVAPHPGKPKQITFDPAQRRAVVAGEVHDVMLIDLATGAVDLRRGHGDSIYQAVFDSRGDRMVTASDDGTARVWDLDTGDSRVLRGHEDDVYGVGMTPDGRTVVTISLDGSARLWRIDDRKTVVFGQLGRVRAIRSLGGDRVRVLSATIPQRVTDVDLRDRSAVVRAEVASPVDEAAITDDGSTVVFARKLDDAVVWRDGVSHHVELPTGSKSGSMTRDGRRAVALLDDDSLYLWQADGAHRSLGKAPDVRQVALSHDGQWMALTGPAGVEIRAVDDGQSKARIDRVSLGVGRARLAVRFLPDDNRLLIADVDGVRVWSWDTGVLVPLASSTFAMVGLVPSPDGNLLAGAAEARSVRVWDARTGAALLTLRGHRDLVRSMAFSPDGGRLATGSYDRTVRVWNLTTGESRVLSGHVGPVWPVTWLGSDRLVSGGDDGTIRLWQVPPLPRPSPEELRARLQIRTTAEIADDDRPATPAAPRPRY